MALALDGQTSIPDRLQLARHYLALERPQRARDIADALANKHPRDARPVTVQASILIHDGLQLEAANKLIKTADDYDHRDAAYYELRIGLVVEAAKSMMSSASFEEAVALVDSLSPIIEAYTAKDFDRGSTLQIGIRVAKVALGVQRGQLSQSEFKAARDRALTDVGRRRRSDQAGPYLRRLELLLARLDPDPLRTLQLAGAKPAFNELAGYHAQLRLYAALATGAIDSAVGDLSQPKSFAALEARTALVAAQAFTRRDPGLWRQVAVQLNKLSDQAEGDQAKARLQNNRAVVAYHLGDKTTARELLATLVDKPAAPPEAVYNFGVILGEFSETAPTIAGPNAAILSTHKDLWRLRQSRNTPITTAEVAKAMAQQVPTSSLGAPIRGEYGIVLSNAMEMGLGLRDKARLALNVAVQSTPIYILTAVSP